MGAVPKISTRSFTQHGPVGLMMLALAGCESTAVIPRAGPEPISLATRASTTVGSRSETSALPYVLVDVDPTTIKLIPHDGGNSFGSLMRYQNSGGVRPQRGDVISVTIYESGTGGLFSSVDPGGSVKGGGSNQTTLPIQTVDQNGNITVPYAGQVPVAGLTIREIQDTIVDRLKSRAIEPQVIVSVQEQRSSQVSVLGDVNSAGVYPLAQSGSRVLDAIARAGGPKSQPYETAVYLQRRNSRVGVSLSKLLARPSENIYLAPSDTIMLVREPRSFVIVGAAAQNSRVDFDRPTITLSDAIGKAAGLLDDRSDAGAVFIYRFEPRAVVARMGADMTNFADSGDRVPVLYRVNLSTPQGYFIAKDFEILNGDVVFIANAMSVEFKKFFDMLRGPTSQARDIFTIRQLLQNTSSGVSVVP